MANRPAAVAEQTRRGAAWGKSNGWSHQGGYWYRNGQRTNFVFIAGAYPWDYNDYWAYYSPYGDYPYYGYNAYGTPAAVGESTAANVQSVLARDGYYSGPIDGIIGPASRAAISSYQSSRGLPVTGQIDQGLLSSMGM